MIQEYDQSELGVEALAAFALTGMKPPPLGEHEMSVVPSLPASSHRSNKRLDHLRTNAKKDQDFDHSLRSPWNSSKSWSASHSGVLQTLGFSPATQRADHRNPNPISSSPGDFAYTSENYQSTTTPHTQSSECTLNENDFLTPYDAANTNTYQYLGPKFANSFLSETWILMRRNFINIRRTPELFLSRLVVLTVMGIMMDTMFMHPKENLQGITDRLSFFIFTVCLFFLFV